MHEMLMQQAQMPCCVPAEKRRVGVLLKLPCNMVQTCLKSRNLSSCRIMQAKEWKNVPAPCVTMVSFGQPRVGNLPFAQDYGEMHASPSENAGF